MGKKRGGWLLIIFLYFLSSTSVVLAQETYDITISVNAINIDGYNSRYFIYDFNAQNMTEGNQVVGKNNILKFSLYQGFYELSIGIDNPATPGFDYYGKISINADTNKSAELDAVPVGSRKIEILDMDDVPLNDIPVRIDCVALSGEQRYFRTDNFGIAEAYFLPMGNCTFRAAAGDFVISQDDYIDKGSAKNIVMKFDKYSASNPNTIWVIIIVIVILVLSTWYFIFYKKNVKKNNANVAGPHDKKHAHAAAKKNSLNDVNDDVVNDDTNNDASNVVSKDSIKKDIMTALSANERKVVNYLLDEQEKHAATNGRFEGFYLHQAKIVYGAGIPKTTLVRLLQSLEAKKIIEWEKSGKIKKVKLTEWFNSK